MIEKKIYHFNIYLFFTIPLLFPLLSFHPARLDFTEIVNRALAAGQRNIDIPKGSYYMKMENGEPLRLNNLKDVTINANGSEIITRQPSLAIILRNCENVKLKGFSIDCEKLPFTQAKIVAVDKDGLWWDAAIMVGYPPIDTAHKLPDRIQIFDPHTQNLKKNIYTYFANVFSKIEKVNKRTFRFYKKQKNEDANEAVGDYIVMSLDVGHIQPHSIVVSKSKKISLEDISIYSGNCFGFFEDQCESNSYNRCRITKKTDDPKVAIPRLRSINADAFHSKSATVGPTITNCIFMYNGDDGIAINTSLYKVVGSQKNNVDIVSTYGDFKFNTGDMMRFIDAEGRVIGDAKLIGMDGKTNFSDKELQKVEQIFKTTKEEKVRAKFKRLILDRKIDIGAGGVVSSLATGGDGFVVKNNSIGYNRARGILIKSSNGIISGNTIVGCELGGIVLSPELVWMEAGFSRNVLIQNNTVRDCMFANSTYGIEQAAPISIVAITALGKIAPAGGFKNIRILNNKIYNSPKPAIIVTSSDGVVIKGNEIAISKKIIRTHGSKFGVDNTQAIWTKNTSNLIASDNNIR